MSDALKLCAGAWGFRQMEIPAYLDACAELGFPCAEMNVSDDPQVCHLRPTNRPEVLDAMAKAERQSGVKVVCLCAGNDFTGDDPSVRRSIEAVKGQIDLAADVGAEVIRVFAGWTAFEQMRDQTYRRCGEALCEVGEYGQGKGVLVALENHGGPAGTAAQVRRILELTGHANVKANYDGGNFAFCREDPLGAYEVLREWVGYTHWKDVIFVDGRPEYCALGDGITDWAPVVRALLRDGYQGYWTMEYEEPSDIDVGMRKCIDVVTAVRHT